MEWKKVKGGFGNVVDSLLKSFIALAVFKGRCVSYLCTSVVDGNSRCFKVGLRITEKVG